MGFEKFGTVSFTAESRASAFVDNLEKGHVMATRCRTCGTISFPPKMDCPVLPVQRSRLVRNHWPGTLVTYAEVTYGPTGFENDAPYVLALVDYGKFKVFGRMTQRHPGQGSQRRHESESRTRKAARRSHRLRVPQSLAT